MTFYLPVSRLFYLKWSGDYATLRTPTVLSSYIKKNIIIKEPYTETKIIYLDRDKDIREIVK